MPGADITSLDSLPLPEFVARLGPLFEGAPGFLRRLGAERPFGSWPALWDAATRVAGSMPEADQVELLDAHPPLGAPPGSVSALSFVEQGYDRDGADAAAETERRRVDAELARLNAAYEAAFGFRYCVFVAGRPRAALLDDFAAALAGDRNAELRRGLIDVIRIAQDRQRKLAGEA